ncbi:hypothetical protein [Mucilaginibacter sp. SG564]|uniref:hypothetical protein n=1 Tax=Mucilaginibacter sp. SG564 TaxID=2587022 RepID=UPI00155457BB|nr:hypothetical protein [Mucilaginibacter sp. SG564]NOW97182.1 hypothetical protein [Mucilaginibacter sp. SG564]
MNPSEHINPQMILDLILALKNAEEEYQEARSAQNVPQLDILLEELPISFGKLLSSLDLIDAFARIGRTVRSFADAHEILLKLNIIINDKLELGQSEETKAQVTKMFQLCDEVTLINTALASPSRLRYPDDFLPGEGPFSEN